MKSREDIQFNFPTSDIAYLEPEVELHVAVARIVRVLLGDEAQWRPPRVQVAVLEEEFALCLRPCD